MRIKDRSAKSNDKERSRLRMVVRIEGAIHIKACVSIFRIRQEREVEVVALLCMEKLGGDW